MYSQDFQFFPPGLAQLQERELAVFKVFLDFITDSQFKQSLTISNRELMESPLLCENLKVQMTLRKSWKRSVKPRRSSLTPVRSFILWNYICLLLTAEPLTEDEMALKESFIEQGFPDWSRRDFQQFVRALEAYGWYVTNMKCGSV